MHRQDRLRFHASSTISCDLRDLLMASSLLGGTVQHFMTQRLGLGFVSCERDCVGAAVTDGLLAAHAAYTACRILWRTRKARQLYQPAAKSSMSFATLAVMAILSNCGWSVLGTYYWPQPGGEPAAGFEVVWRLSALCQASLCTP